MHLQEVIDVIHAHEKVLRRDTGPLESRSLAGIPAPRHPDIHARRNAAADAEAKRRKATAAEAEAYAIRQGDGPCSVET